MADTSAPKRERGEGEEEDDAQAKKRLREDADDGEIDEDGQEVQRPPPEPAAAEPASDERAADATDAAAGAGAAASASALSAEPEAAAAAASSASESAAPAAPPPGATAVPAYSTDAPAVPSITDDELANLLRMRGEAKARRDFNAADTLRAQLESYGIKVVDARSHGSLGTWTDSTGRKCVSRRAVAAALASHLGAGGSAARCTPGARTAHDAWRTHALCRCPRPLLVSTPHPTPPSLSLSLPVARKVSKR